MLSVVVPVFNEREGVVPFCQELLATLRLLNAACEVIVVDDGSRDGTFELVCRLGQDNPEIRALQLSRNFGHQAALLAGLQAAGGEWIVMLDGDGQHPPELIPELLAQARAGYDIVHTCRANDGELPLLKRLTSRAFYRVWRWLAGVDMPPNAADFRLISRRVRDAIVNLEERDLFLRGLFCWTGYPQIWMPYASRARMRGRSKYGTLRMLGLALSGLTAFSTAPIRLASVSFSALALLVAVLYSLYAAWVRLVLHQAVPGWASLLILNSFFFSGLFVLTGLIGEYVAKIHIETKRRPHFIVSRQWPPEGA